MDANLYAPSFSVDRHQREKKQGHKGLVVWLYGLSGSGKSTLANAAENILQQKGISTYILDGDVMRSGLNTDLSFSAQDRSENIRRACEVAYLFKEAACVVFCCFITPFEKDRQKIQERIGKEHLLTTLIDCPLATCEKRDPKGLYAKARRKEINNFTGIDSPFDESPRADLTLFTAQETLEESTNKLVSSIFEKIRLT